MFLGGFIVVIFNLTESIKYDAEKNLLFVCKREGYEKCNH
jgi:hypothetical protein